MNYRFFLAAWLLGMPGVVAVAILVLPGIVASQPMTMPIWGAQIASIIQGGLLMAVAVLAGMMFAPEVGLAAPVLAAASEGKSWVNAARSQILPALVGAVSGATVMWAFAAYAPSEITGVQARPGVPAVVRLLYGGITEELLVRWGVMTVVMWCAWRVLQDGKGDARWLTATFGIVVSALMFGVVHLPIAVTLLGAMPPLVAVVIVVANSAFGVVMGILFWRFGLEAAIMAHVGAHVIILLTTG